MKEPIFLALLFVYSLSVIAHDSFTKLKVSENGTIEWYGKETNESNKSTKNMNPTDNDIQMSSQYLGANMNRNKRDTTCIPGTKPSTHLKNSEKKNHTVSSILDSLNQGTANIKYTDDPHIILLLGLSGAGKSTLAQYLFGNNSNLMAVAKRNMKCQATGDFYIEDTGKKIGHNAVLSHTELPDLVIDPEKNTTIYDCPGFSDTRDPEHDISGAYFIKAVSDKAKALKFIFVVNYNSITNGANRNDFIILARHATNLIHNILKYNESIALVATKIKDDKSDDQRIIAIADFLSEVRQTLNETNEEPNVQSFIDILLTTNGPDNQDYTKIGLMPKFDTAGRLIDLPGVQDHKKSLLTLIFNNIKFTEIDTTDLKPTISSDSVYYIDGLVNEVTQQMWIHINNVVQKVQVFYNDLIQNMLDTIHTFNDEKIVVDIDQLKAELFLTKLNTGLSVISEVIKNIKSQTTLNELSKYMIKSALILETDLSQDIVSNISTQHEYLKFLLSVHEPKHSFNVDAVITLLTNLENELKISINHFHSNVSDVTNQIENTISSINNNIMNQIQKNFSSITETVLDNAKMSSLMNSGRSELLEIRNSANSPDITYKCINQIIRTVNHFNFTATNIQSVDHIVQKTSKLVDELYFLQTLKDESVNSNSLKCTDDINRVISYLDDLGKWYNLLFSLFKKLSGYTVQKNIGTCNNLSKSIMNHKAPTRVADVIPGPFVEECFTVNEYNTAGIDNFMLDKFQLDSLKRIIKHTLYHNSSYSCDSKLSDHSVMKRQDNELSDLNKCLYLENSMFVKDCFPFHGLMFNTAHINKVKRNNYPLNAFDRKLNYQSFDLKSPDHVVMKGHYIKLSDLNKCPHIENAKFVEIFALKKIFIDADIDKIGDQFSLSIIAPIWEIHGLRKIKLDGKPGDAHGQQKAASGLSVSIPNGEDGAPGLPGGPGGNFLGIGATFIDSNDLSISADGGSGGPGQDGGDGMDGRDDTECPDTMKNENFPNKEHCSFYDESKLGRVFTRGCTAQSTFNGFSLDISVPHYLKQDVTCYPKNDGPFKGNGTNAGNGGKGGIGGHAGNITLIAKGNQSMNLSNKVGKTGSDGNGGVGGEAGKKGNDLLIEMALHQELTKHGMRLVKIPDWPLYQFVASNKSYFPGESGTNGYHTENRKDPEKAVSQPNFVHQSIIDYKTYFNEHSSDNTEDVDIINFLDILEKP